MDFLHMARPQVDESAGTQRHAVIVGYVTAVGL